MITLNINKELIRLNNWSDLQERAGFLQNLNPNDMELKEIIGRYHEAEPVHCGLTTCHTLHNRGYIVVATNGCETNIGHQCGKKYFGVEFETMSKQLDFALDMKECRERLEYFDRNEFDNLKKWIDEKFHVTTDIRKFLRKINNEDGDCTPSQIINVIQDMIKTGNSKLSKSRRLTESEIQLKEQMLQKERHELKSSDFWTEDFIANIQGIEIMNSVNDIKKLLIIDLKDTINSFPRGKIDTLSDKDLKKWDKWQQEIPAKKEKISQLINAGILFFDYDNLNHFSKILNNRTDRYLWKKFLTPLKLLKSNK